MAWIGGRMIHARELILQHLLPVARDGLLQAGILPADVDRYLGIIEERVRTGRTGSQWLLDSMAGMRKTATKDEVLTSLTAATVKRQRQGSPVHAWLPAQMTEGDMQKPSYLRVEEFMTTDLFTVHADEPLDLVANLMDWKRVRHIPVEDEQGRLVGLISCFDVLRHLERSMNEPSKEPIAVSSIMNKEPLTVTPETLTLDAIALMRRARVDCLPVVKEGRLVGIVSERDFINVAARLLENTVETCRDGDAETPRLPDAAKAAQS